MKVSRLTADGWIDDEDTLAGSVTSTSLKDQGWYVVMNVGRSWGWRIEVYARADEHGDPGWLLDITEDGGGLVLVDRFPDVLDLVARWSPIITAYDINYVIGDWEEFIREAAAAVQKEL